MVSRNGSRWGGLRLAAAMAWCAWSLPAQGPGAVAFRTYGPEQGLEGLGLSCMVRDGRGFLWVGTRGGLFRLEDQRFRAFGSAQGLPSESITALCPDGAEGLWIGTELGFAHFDGRTFRPLGPEAGLPQRPVEAVVQDASRRLWVAFEGRLFVRSDEGSFEPAVPVLARDMHGVWADPRQRGLLLLTRSGALHLVLKAGSSRPVPLPAAPRSEPVLAAVRDPAGSTWIRTAKRLLRVGDDGRILEEPGKGLDLAGPPWLSVDPAGRVWTPGADGPWGFLGGSRERVRLDLKRDARNVHQVLVDRDGSPWLLGDELIRVLGRSLWTVHRIQGPEAAPLAVMRPGTGPLLAVLPSGLAEATPGGWRTLATRPGMSLKAAAQANGRAWVVDRTCTRILRQGDLLEVRLPLGAAPIATALAVERSGRVWIGTEDAGLLSVRQGPSGWEARPESLPGGSLNERIRALLVDRDGLLWVAGSRGLAVLDGDVWRRLGPREGLRPEPVEVLAEAPDGELWLGCEGGRALDRVRYTGGRIHRLQGIGGQEGLAGASFRALACDSRGVLWIGTTRGVFRWDGRLEHFGRGDGLPGELCQPGGIWVDGDVWVATTSGLARFRTAAYQGLPEAPETLITEAVFGGQASPNPVSPDQGLQVPWRGRSAEFRFLTPSAGNPQKLQRQVALVGFEGEWRTAEGSSVRYASLAPGLYQFQVRSRTGTGSYGPPAVLRFRILAPWWMSRWFQLLAGAGLLGLGWIGLRWRGRVLERKNEELQALIQRQTEDLKLALREAEDANSAKGEFLATMSHEIRTPMHAILGMTNHLLETRLTREQMEAAKAVKQAASGLLTILNDVLDYSRLEASEVALKASPFDLCALTEELMDLMSPAAMDKGLELVLRYLPDQPRAYLGDEDRLRQVLTNLLGNAVKFTASGCVALGVELLESSPREHLLRIWVQDTGEGIAADKLDAVFEKFSQADSSIRRRFGGTGLGLAICRRLVEQMGGQIGVDSQPGRGSRFWFTVPLPPAAAAREIVPASPRWPGLGVLVVDGLELTRQVLSDYFNAWGVAHHVTGDPEEAVALWEQAGPPLTLALLDQRFETLARKGLARKGEPPTSVLMVPMHQTVEPGHLQAAGVQGILRKPVCTWELEELLDRVWHQRESVTKEWLEDQEITREFFDPALAGLPQRPMEGLRVLLVEDNALNQMVAHRLLTDLGARVDLAQNGAEGMVIALTDPYDLVVMDGSMPCMDGFQATRAIRAGEWDRRTPILGMSAHALPAHKRRFLDAGMDAFLTKPFERADLLKVLRPFVPALRIPDPERTAPEVAPVPVNPEAPLDETALVRSCGGSSGLDVLALRETLHLFLQQAALSREALTRAMAAADGPTAREAAHKLCGSAAYVYAKPLAKACAEMEERCAAGDMEAARVCWALAQGTLEAAVEAARTLDARLA